jgi:putative ABC transport system permease protein
LADYSIEGLLLGTVGGIVGLIVAPMATRGLAHTVVVGDASQFPFNTSIDLRVLLFNFLMAFAASVMFSLAPALRFLSPDLATSLKQQAGTSGASPLRFRRVTVGLQIGLSLLLVVGAGLFVRTLHNLESQDVGSVTGHLVTFGLNPQLAGYSQEQVNPLHQRVLDTLAALLGVSSFDPVTLLAGTLLVAFVALLAALLPARRAASVEPMKALRTE